MYAGRKGQEQAQAAAAQNVLQPRERPSRPPTFDQRIQAVEEGINQLAEMIEDYKKRYRSTEPEPPAKKPKRKAAQTRKPANTLGKKATNANGKEPRVRKPTNTESMVPTSYQALEQPKIEALVAIGNPPTIKAIDPPKKMIFLKVEASPQKGDDPANNFIEVFQQE